MNAKPRNTEEARAAGWVECRKCGHRAPAPEPHYAVPPIQCETQEGDWMTPLPRSWELPRAQASEVQVFTPPPRPRRKAR